MGNGMEVQEISLAQEELLQDEVKWGELQNPHAVIPESPAGALVTVLQGRVRKEACWMICWGQAANQVCTASPVKSTSKTKLRRMMEQQAQDRQLHLLKPN